MSTREALAHLSALRLGTFLKLIDSVPLRTLHTLMIAMQPWHLQAAAGRELRSQERDAVRARLIREALGSGVSVRAAFRAPVERARRGRPTGRHADPALLPVAP
jgi:hypothetical protein